MSGASQASTAAAPARLPRRSLPWQQRRLSHLSSDIDAQRLHRCGACCGTLTADAAQLERRRGCDAAAVQSALTDVHPPQGPRKHDCDVDETEEAVSGGACRSTCLWQHTSIWKHRTLHTHRDCGGQSEWIRCTWRGKVGHTMRNSGLAGPCNCPNKLT